MPIEKPEFDIENTEGLPAPVSIASEDGTRIAGVTSEGEVKISSFANVQFISGNKTVNNTTETLACAGISNLANRKSLIIFNRGSQSIFYGPTGVTETNGIEIAKDELITLNVGENIQVYLISSSGNPTVTIQELS